MKTIKLSYLILGIFLAGCQTGGFEPIIEVGRLISENSEISNLPSAERCERVHVDLREGCRKRAKEEVDELSEAMSKTKND